MSTVQSFTAQRFELGAAAQLLHRTSAVWAENFLGGQQLAIDSVDVCFRTMYAARSCPKHGPIT